MMFWLVALIGLMCFGLAYGCHRLHMQTQDLQMQLTTLGLGVMAAKSGLYERLSFPEKDWSKILSSIGDISMGIADLKKENERLERLNSDLMKEVDELDTEGQSLWNKIHALREELQEEEDKHDKYVETLTSSHMETSEELTRGIETMRDVNSALSRRFAELRNAARGDVRGLMDSNDYVVRKLTEKKKEAEERLAAQAPVIKELRSKLQAGEKRWQGMQDQKVKAVEHNRKLKAALKKVENENHKLKESNLQLKQQASLGLVQRSPIDGDRPFDGGGSQQTCVVCWNSPLNVMIFPCNHVCLCKKCSPKVEDVCPICKAGIEEKINVFIS